MIELRINCPECERSEDKLGKIQLDMESGQMRVECGWCHSVWMLEAPVATSHIETRDNWPSWKKELLGVEQ